MLAVLARGEDKGTRGSEGDHDVRAVAQPARLRMVEQLVQDILGRSLPGQPARDV